MKNDLMQVNVHVIAYKIYFLNFKILPAFLLSIETLLFRLLAADVPLFILPHIEIIEMTAFYTPVCSWLSDDSIIDCHYSLPFL